MGASERTQECARHAFIAQTVEVAASVGLLGSFF
jgi:hypothetical protein